MTKAFPAVLALAAAFVWWSAGSLPERVASHFGTSGLANGFMPRGEYVAFMLALVVAVPTLLFLLGSLAARIPVSLVNLPHRAYWLAPERRTATLATLGRFGAWAACATLAMLCAAHGFVVRANEQHPPRLEQAPFVGLMALFVVAMFAGMLVVLRRFFTAPAPPRP